MDAFRGLEMIMRELSLSHNKLKAVPTEALMGMQVLNTLTLKCNNIGNITKPLFKNVSTLIELNLACNEVRSLH